MAVIYFDIDGTLLQFDRPFDRIFALACERVGVEAPEGTYETYTAAFFDAFEALSSDPYREGARAAVDHHDLATDPTSLADAVLASERESTSVVAGARKALAALDEEHRLGILSNGVGDVQRAKLARHGLGDRFEVELVSHDLGVLKPDPEIFSIARDRLDADRYVYVADDVDHDIRPATDLGFETVHVVADDGDDSVDFAEDDGDDSVASSVDDAVAPVADHRVGATEFGRIPDVL